MDEESLVLLKKVVDEGGKDVVKGVLMRILKEGKGLRLVRVLYQDYEEVLLDDSEEAKMLLVVCVGFSLKFIKGSDRTLAKTAWELLVLLIGKRRQEVQGVFPGVLVSCVEGLQRYVDQGVGASRFVFDRAIECVTALLEYFQGEWGEMALRKSRGAIDKISELVLQGIQRGLILKKHVVAEFIMRLLKVCEGGKLRLLEGMILLDLEGFRSFELTEEEAWDIFMYLWERMNGQRSAEGLGVCIGKMKKFNVFLRVNCRKIMKKIFELAEFTQHYEDSVWRNLRLVGGKSEYLVLLQVLEKIVQFEVLDELIDEGHRIIKRVGKNEYVGELYIGTVAFLLSFNSTEHGLYLLEKCLGTVKGEIVNLMYIKLVYGKYRRSEIGELECVESVLLAYSDSTRIYIGKKFKGEFGELVQKYNTQLSDFLVSKLHITGLSGMSSCLVYYLDFLSGNSFVSFLDAVLREYDSHLRLYSSDDLLAIVKLFSASFVKLEANFLTTGNIIRSVLLRLKPLLSLPMNILENRRTILAVLKLFTQSMKLLDNKPIDIDPSDKSSFAIEEPSNASIPNGLASLAYDCLPTFCYVLKSIMETTCSGIICGLLELFIEISTRSPDFFVVDERFVNKIYPLLRQSLQLEGNATRKPEIIERIVKLITNLRAEAVVSIQDELLSLSNRMSTSETKQIQEIGLLLRKK